jgi:Protein of unknown function (DUF2934)
MGRREKKVERTEFHPENGTPLSTDMHERIKRRAFELFQLRGEIPGQDKEDWFEAERQVRFEVGDPTREVG